MKNKKRTRNHKMRKKHKKKMCRLFFFQIFALEKMCMKSKSENKIESKMQKQQSGKQTKGKINKKDKECKTLRNIFFFKINYQLNKKTDFQSVHLSVWLTV